MLARPISRMLEAATPSRSAVGRVAGHSKATPETLIDSVSASTSLSNTALAVGSLPILNLSGITTANLTDTSAGGNTFTVTGWTGKGTLSGTLGDADGELCRPR